MSRTATLPQLAHPIARLTGGGYATLIFFAVFLVAMAVGLAILLHFYDRFWWAPDEGAYAHVAERMLQGEGQNGSLQDLHMGYVHFANALAFKLFGIDLVSLRYPLVLTTLLQSAVVFGLLAGRGMLVAFVAALAMSSLSFVQFLNPTAHWYALFLCVVIVAFLSAEGRERFGRLELLGFLLISLFLFCQLSGVFAAMGLMTFLLLQEQRHPGRQHTLLARGLALVMMACLALYLRASVDLAAGLLFGAAPLILLGYAAATTQLTNRLLAQQLLRLGLGGLLALLPLLAYHLAQGSLLRWWDDTVFAAISLAGFNLVDAPSYAALSMQGLEQILSGGGKVALLNGFFWFLLPLLPACLGLVMLRALLSGAPEGRAALPLVACFYSLVSMHHQIPFSLFYATALTIAALLFLGATARKIYCVGLVCAVIVLSLVGLSYQAGQPLTRSWDQTVAGKTSGIMTASGLPRVSLTIAVEDAVHYSYLLQVIETETSVADSILALPVNPELYFLGRRRNSLRFSNAAFGLRDEEDLAEANARLGADLPRLLFYRPEDRYNTPLVRRLVAELLPRYRLLDAREGVEIYRLND